MKIEQKYTFGPHIFDSLEEAEKFVTEQEDSLRIEAFCDHLRNNGAQRVSSTVTNALEEFIKFEKGFYDTEAGTKELEAKATNPVKDSDDDEQDTSNPVDKAPSESSEEEASEEEPVLNQFAQPPKSKGASLFAN